MESTRLECRLRLLDIRITGAGVGGGGDEEKFGTNGPNGVSVLRDEPSSTTATGVLLEEPPATSDRGSATGLSILRDSNIEHCTDAGFVLVPESDRRVNSTVDGLLIVHIISVPASYGS
uniref:Uncharacterized protein n=1 Tax=Strigamia maritima TaxID=126957 RepID=T1IZQ9_STRMM